MQPVDPSHQLQVGRADRAGQVVHRASADARQLGLARDGEVVIRVEHRFALSNPVLVSAPSKKSFSNVSWPILGCSGTRSTGSWASAAPPPKASAACSSSLLLPVGDLVGVRAEMLGQFGQGAVFTQGKPRPLAP